MATYIERTDLEHYALEKDALSSMAQDALLESASRLFDEMCEVAPQFFDAADDTASERTFYGAGGTALILPPYVEGSITAVTTEYGTPTYREESGVLILTSDSDMAWWRANEPVTVTAKWGFTATPADVKLAVAALAVSLLRTMDPAKAELDGTGEVIKQRQVPEVANLTAKKYRQRYSRRFVFA